jgi:hypothetical protein
MNGVEFTPIGIMTIQKSALTTSDAVGARNFTTRSIINGALVVHDDLRDAGTFTYHVVFHDPNGNVYARDGDPEIHNKPDSSGI